MSYPKSRGKGQNVLPFHSLTAPWLDPAQQTKGPALSRPPSPPHIRSLTQVGDQEVPSVQILHQEPNGSLF